MKKWLLFVMIQVWDFQTVISADLTPEQSRLRNGIQSFLKEEGFMPEIDSDGEF